MKLEEMDVFFETRLQGYESHMLQNIESAEAFYPFTAALLPDAPGTSLLDLGCGTGLELRWYFRRAPAAQVTGIDLSEGMLKALRDTYPEKHLTLLRGDYFRLPFGEAAFDAAVSVESLHHFTKAEKLPLYRKLHKALKPGGFFVLTDYFALSEAEEQRHRSDLESLLAAQPPKPGVYYHFDTPLTVAHETEALLEAGFRKVEVLKNWGATHTLKAFR